ncbi:glutamate racemase [Permianibacter sp. IMCC34836]|uniref:glutamate racemase n=1 Tax=Permianibacter fluminis TaxID=2738515 RepID=UPI001551D4B0|nr:glutamate racemase [Permianibacter fluminis]NQD36980.1 glutamate racemase [Permianibacter fluminis]
MSTALAPVLVFDSGVGGLSIFADIAAALPSLPLVFACDNAFFPYGTKAEDELVERVDAVLHALIDRIQPRLIVIACNTASTVALPRLRSRFALPIVGVVPAIKPAAKLSRNRVIGLLATPATVQRPYTDQLIREFASDCTVIKVGSRELVQLAEAKLRGTHISVEALQPILAPFFADPDRSADTIVLGCTHFPLLRQELAAAARQPVQWVDSGEAIARRVETLIGRPPEQPAPATTAWMTADNAEARALWPALAQQGFSTLQFITI